MIRTTCPTCKSVNYRSPSKVQPRNYCDSICYSETRRKELNQEGRAHRFKKGRPEMQARLDAMHRTAGANNYAWKGEEVSYRGLHQWVRRKKGKPTQCSHCSKQDSRPRYIQWANIDGKYRRAVEDFIALCASCHKYHDLSLAKSSEGSPFATQ